MLHVGGSFDQASALVDLLDELVAEADAEPGLGLHRFYVCRLANRLVSPGFHLRFLQVTPWSLHTVCGGACASSFRGRGFRLFPLKKAICCVHDMSCQCQTT